MTVLAHWSRGLPRGLRMLCRVLALAGLAALAGCGASGGSSSPTPPPNDDNNVSVAREIEEADIIHLDGDILYVANPYTGLRLIDVSHPEAPKFLEAFPLAGRAVEMFVRDGTVFIFTDGDFQYCAGEPVGYGDNTWNDVARPDYSGTRLWVIDVSNPADMALRTTITFAGNTVGTRRVGDVIYAAGFIGTNGFVQSVNIADPGHVVPVENHHFDAHVDFVHVTDSAVYLIGPDATEAETSLVTYMDISDPAGNIAIRDSFRVRGTIASRFFMDASAGTFRVVTEEFQPDTYTWVVALYIYDVSNPDDIQRLSRLPIATDDSLRSVRFDGNRAYVATFFNVDPLHVLDLSDPTAPTVASEITVPGFSTSLYPLGDRLVAVGFSGGFNPRPAVSLYDVADPKNVKVLSQVTLGEPDDWTTGSAALVDEKAVRILPNADLILMPLARYDYNTGDYADELQLISMTEKTLKRRGTIPHRGLVRRADMLEDCAWVLSDLAFQILNIDDLAKPKSLASLDFVTEQDLLDAGLLRCADSARIRGTSVWGVYGGYIGCGAVPVGALAVTALGIMSLGRIRRRAA